MKTVIVTRAYLDRAHTFKWLLDSPSKNPFIKNGIIVITHTKEMAKRIKEAYPVLAEKCQVIATNGIGLLEQRNYPFKKNLIKVDEWFIGMDDNITAMQQLDVFLQSDDYKFDILTEPVPLPFSSWREAFRAPMNIREVYDAFEQLAKMCRSADTYYGGFASVENPLYRARPYSYRRFVKSKAFVMRRVDKAFRWAGGNYAHDSEMSVRAVAQCGRVVVNNMVHPKHKMYEKGGLGDITERNGFEGLMREIIKTYPGLVTRANGPNSALKFLKTHDSNVFEWRRANGYL